MKTKRIIPRFFLMLIVLLSLSNYACEREYCIDCMESITSSYYPPSEYPGQHHTTEPYTRYEPYTFCFDSRKEAE